LSENNEQQILQQKLPIYLARYYIRSVKDEKSCQCSQQKRSEEDKRPRVRMIGV